MRFKCIVASLGANALNCAVLGVRSATANGRSMSSIPASVSRRAPTNAYPTRSIGPGRCRVAADRAWVWDWPSSGVSPDCGNIGSRSLSRQGAVRAFRWRTEVIERRRDAFGTDVSAMLVSADASSDAIALMRATHLDARRKPVPSALEATAKPSGALCASERAKREKKSAPRGGAGGQTRLGMTG